MTLSVETEDEIADGEGIVIGNFLRERAMPLAHDRRGPFAAHNRNPAFACPEV
jgi:hypothetical protein